MAETEPSAYENVIKQHIGELQTSVVLQDEALEANTAEKWARTVNIACGILVTLIGIALTQELDASTARILKIASAVLGALVAFIAAYFDPAKSSPTIVCTGGECGRFPFPEGGFFAPVKRGVRPQGYLWGYSKRLYVGSDAQEASDPCLRNA